MNSDSSASVKIRRIERISGLAALAVIIAAWILGSFKAEAELAPFLQKTVPGAGYIEPLADDIYAAFETEAKNRLMAAIAVGESDGYGGTMKVAVALDAEGKVLGSQIISHKETASFFSRVLRHGLPGSLEGKSYSDPFLPGEDVDSITGATRTTLALVESVRRAARHAADKGLGLHTEPESFPTLHIGLPEVILVLLFLSGFMARSRLVTGRGARIIRWATMIAGMAALGFVFNRPLTLTLINKMLLGYWPGWQLHLYTYILLGGVFLTFLIADRNPYCDWFCPFGAVQETLGVVGGAKGKLPSPLHTALRWGQRVLALGAVVLALLTRNPGISSYEVFGAMFHLIGANWLFILLGGVLIASLILRRPWCSYLCPLRPVTDYVRMMRRWNRDIFSAPPPQKNRLTKPDNKPN